MSGAGFKSGLQWIKSGAFVLAFLFSTNTSFAALNFDADAGEFAVVVASSQGIGASAFGHAFLRIQKKMGIWASNDYVIEIAAYNGQDDFSAFRGLGFISPYPARMSVLSYARMLDLKTREELRDLDNYVLNLTPEQRQKALKAIERLSEKRDVGTYSFFWQNCASYVSEILNEAGIEYLHGLWANVPSKMPDKLEELGFVKSKFTDRSAGSIRELLLQKFPRPEISDPQVALIWPSIKKQLGSESIQDRILGYLKLHYIGRLDSSPQDLKRQSRSLMRQFIMQEAVDLRTDLIKTFLDEKGAAAIRVFPLFQKMLSLYDLRSVRGLSLEGDRSGAFVRVENASPFNHAEDGTPPTDDKVPFSQLRFDSEAGAFHFEKKLMGAKFSDDVWENEYFAPGVSFFYEVVIPPGRREEVLVYAVIDETRELAPVRWTSNDFLDFTNQELTKKLGNAGACFGVAKMQESFYLRSVFRPELPRLKDLKSYSKLIERMMQGDYVIFPGYHHVKELTHDLERLPLMELAVQLTEKNNEFGNLVKGFFNNSNLDEEVLQDMTNLGRIGIPSAIAFRKKRSPVGHVLMIDGVSFSDSGYAMTGYDPNWGETKVRIDRENFNIHSLFYNEMERPFLIATDLARSYTDLQRKKKLLTPEFLKYALETGQYAFSAREIGVY